MNTRVCLLGSVFVVFIILLWVSYVRKETFVPPDKREKYGVSLVPLARLGVSNYLSGWTDWKDIGGDIGAISFKDMIQLQDGTFACIEWFSSKIWVTKNKSKKLSGKIADWEQLDPNNNDIIFYKIQQLKDGTFVGIVNSNWHFWTSTKLSHKKSDWKEIIPVSADFWSYDIIELQDGTFARIDFWDALIYTCPTLSGQISDWTKLSNDGRIIFNRIIQLQDGSFECIVRGNYYILHSKKLTNTFAGDWVIPPGGGIPVGYAIFTYYE